MLKRLLNIKSVGRFVNWTAKGDFEFRKLNLIYSENGRGKSTLAAILRSLRSGHPEPILERATLGSAVTPEVAVMGANGTATFKNAHWDSHIPHLEVFDAEFVNTNVYSGSYVDLTHKKNLFQFAVGEQGVTLAHQITALVDVIRQQNSKISTQATEVQKCIVGKLLTLDAFVKLTNEADVDGKISDKEREYSALQEAGTIATKSLFLQASLVPPPLEKVREILRLTLEGVSEAAVAATKRHISTHLDEHGESWIAQGMKYRTTADCPFCGRDATGVTLIQYYAAFFKQEYSQLQQQIAALASDIQRCLTGKELIAVQKCLGGNTVLMEYWSRYLTATLPVINFESLDASFRHLCEQLAARLTLKARSPLEAITFSKDAENAHQTFAQCLNTVTDYNEAVTLVNARISEKKKAVAGGNLQTVKTELERLQNVKARYAPETVGVVTEYLKLQSDRTLQEKQKDDTKSQMDRLTDDLLKKYQDRINHHLACFGTSFRITGKKRRDVGNAPSTTYQIEINGKAVDLGDANTPVGTPCFRTTLSDGDKSTLAFAFFLAKVEQDPAIGDKVVVFDDPISSLDGHRKCCTQQAITEVATKAKQVFVLSHDPLFLRDLYDHITPSTCRTLAVVREGAESSTITGWDIKEETDAEYFRCYRLFRSFLDGSFKGDIRRIATAIRPFLEGHLRMRCPASFAPHEWLGDFIKKIREANVGDPLHGLQSKLQELSAINDYSKGFHHDQNPGAATHPVQDVTLQAYVSRTLQVIGD